ncbi:hypothetical protein ACOSZF_15010 [Cytobacillus firmus]|uniref:Uncharacterized protein n=1 Tax=Cytobacillus firmus TaxID=1399 RepID=A0A800MT75_CYTFI|nr:hypothetical protein [Cytobacillus firmus]KAF0822016.1 hypothetical protein KIS1582_4215 [Cytobacillus firmus]MDD9313898.1 hypothetical protein [Cytobacillus firmus]MEC1892358.1 hypothetical protein [Cytobacillus firmus]MED1907169.1 hypothetical protein [Cytobacillus firmus]MED1941081.1 hypothetical protein [Cytobacillus firmus]
MSGLHARHHKVCTKCMSFSANHEVCQKCGNTNLMNLKITVQSGKNQKTVKTGTG